MRAAVVSAASVLAMAAVANAAPFQFLSFEAGGGLSGVQGAGFYTDGANGFFSSGGNSDFGSQALDNTEILKDEMDSFFTIDDRGPSILAGTISANFYGDLNLAPAYNGVDGQDFAGYGGQAAGFSMTAAPESNIDTIGGGGNGAIGLAQVGLGVSPQPFFSGFAPNQGGGRSTLDGVFIARLTIAGGASLTGGGLFAVLGDEAMITLGGPSVLIGGQPMVLEAYLITSLTNLAEGGFGGDTFATADVYDIWFHVVPTPGTLALLGFGGLAAIRRRRA